MITVNRRVQESQESVLSRRQFMGLGLGLAALIALPSMPGLAGAAESTAASGPMGSPTVCDVSFTLPRGWCVVDSSDEGEQVVIALLDPFTQDEEGMAVLIGGEVPVGQDGFALSADELFARLAQDCASDDGAAWGMERRDIDGRVAAATCSFSALLQDELLVGRLYLAKIPAGGNYVALAVLARPSVVDSALAQAEAMWQGADWGKAIAAGLDEFKQGMLEEGIERNAKGPFYNPHWQVTDFSCTLNTADIDAPYPDHMRYQYSTPEGFTAWEDEIVRASALSLRGASVSVWAMPRTDSEGTSYLRSTAEVVDVGVVDIAFYEELGNVWYIAGTGEAVAPDADLMWRRLDTGGIPWAPYTL